MVSWEKEDGEPFFFTGSVPVVGTEYGAVFFSLVVVQSAVVPAQTVLILIGDVALFGFT